MKNKKSKWNMFLNGQVPYVVLDNVLYRTDRGEVRFAWLCARTGDVIQNTPVERVGTVPITLEEQLNHRGTRLKCLGPYPMRRW